jgi:hypothetical protein
MWIYNNDFPKESKLLNKTLFIDQTKANSIAGFIFKTAYDKAQFVLPDIPTFLFKRRYSVAGHSKLNFLA